ncbi:MAG: hypothetical protein AB7I19_12465 [Planctomycetota bacterium]
MRFAKLLLAVSCLVAACAAPGKPIVPTDDDFALVRVLLLG